MNTSPEEASGHGSAYRHDPARLRVMEDHLNHYLYHPLSRRLAGILLPTGISPNAVSIIGGLVVVLAGLAYVSLDWPYGVATGLALHMAWHVLDGADGDLARLTGSASPLGEVVDGICDYASHIILYLLLAGYLAAKIGPIAWALAVGAGVSRIVQATHFEVQRRQYQNWVHGRAWLRSRPLETSGTASGMLSGLAAWYLKLADRLTRQQSELERLQASAAADQQMQERFCAIIERHFAVLLARDTMLSANLRTLALGGSMLLNTPLWFFLAELTLLNAAFLVSRAAHRRGVRNALTELGGQQPDKTP